MSDDKPTNDRAAFFRVSQQLHDRWMRRCHREDTPSDPAAAVQLERALRRTGSVMGEDNGGENGRDYKTAALRLAAAFRKKETPCR